VYAHNCGSCDAYWWDTHTLCKHASDAQIACAVRRLRPATATWPLTAPFFNTAVAVQVEGVHFMFHNLVQSAAALQHEAEASVTRASANATKPDPVGGCILAHCMGLVSAP
jgi:hypothetical protein